MKKVTYYLIIIFLVFSCKSKETFQERNKAVVNKYFDFFNQHNWLEMANMYADTSEILDPSIGLVPIKQTKSEIVQKYKELQSQFPDVKDSITNMYQSGENQVIVTFISSFQLPDSTKFNLPICTIFTLNNGKIIKDHTYYDNMNE